MVTDADPRAFVRRFAEVWRAPEPDTSCTPVALIHGAWLWENWAPVLAARGFEVHAPQLPAWAWPTASITFTGSSSTLPASPLGGRVDRPAPACAMASAWRCAAVVGSASLSGVRPGPDRDPAAPSASVGCGGRRGTACCRQPRQGATGTIHSRDRRAHGGHLSRAAVR